MKDVPIKKTVAQMVREAEGKIATWTAADAIKHKDDPNVVFVDLRDIRELWRDGTIPNSFHAPRGMLEFWVDPESPYAKDLFKQPKTFVFFCASGWRAALSTATVKDMGLDNVAHIGGGFTAWKAAGGPVAAKEQHEKKS